MRTARLTRIEDELALLCTYTPDLVEAVKSWIPAPQRVWDFERRLWRFHRSQEPALRALLHALDYVVDDAPGRRTKHGK
jgi:hypothetical protein